MRKIVIYRDEQIEKNKTQRITLRSIAPSENFVGYTKNGALIDSKVKELISYLEPTASGYYQA